MWTIPINVACIAIGSSSENMSHSFLLPGPFEPPALRDCYQFVQNRGREDCQPSKYGRTLRMKSELEFCTNLLWCYHDRILSWEDADCQVCEPHTPKLQPPPRIPKKRSEFSVSFAVSILPSPTTTVAWTQISWRSDSEIKICNTCTKLSMVRPYDPESQPYPPPRSSLHIIKRVTKDMWQKEQ